MHLPKVSRIHQIRQYRSQPDRSQLATWAALAASVESCERKQLGGGEPPPARRRSIGAQHDSEVDKPEHHLARCVSGVARRFEFGNAPGTPPAVGYEPRPIRL